MEGFEPQEPLRRDSGAGKVKVHQGAPRLARLHADAMLIDTCMRSNSLLCSTSPAGRSSSTPCAGCRSPRSRLAHPVFVAAQNSGHDQYISLYLSCEPTAAEKERALAEQPAAGPGTGGGGPGAAAGGSGGKEKDRILWRRDGKFLFTFEVRF